MNNDKELYYFITIETTMLDDPSIEVLNGHLQYYEKKEQYMICAGIKLGIDFAKFKKLLNLTIEQNDKRDN